MVYRKLHSIRVLLIEDDEDDFFLLDRALEEVSSARYEVTWAKTYESGLQEIERGGYDVCLLDYYLGAKNGLEILARVAKSAAAPPIIVLTGRGDYRVDLRAMEYGAADYLVKDQVSGPLLERAIRYSMERLKAKRALLESESQQKHLASALLRVQENERRMIAAELHDDFGQLLPAVKFHLESVLARMDPGDSCASDLRGLLPSIQGAIERVRNMYTELMPTVLDDLGILPTLGWFCREFQKDHPDIAVDSQFLVEEQEVVPDLKLAIFRIVQEVFKNVATHSGAGRIRVLLLKEDAYLSLAISDNGNGFDISGETPSAKNPDGLGLMSMQRRAELSGGALRIDSAKGTGTLVSARWRIGER
ncbi:MAG: response regulator [Syntrophobacteraceae bacterium]|nr:response regulator [Syntrophobacteraceae bacterium]